MKVILTPQTSWAHTWRAAVFVSEEKFEAVWWPGGRVSMCVPGRRAVASWEPWVRHVCDTCEVWTFTVQWDSAGSRGDVAAAEPHLWKEDSELSGLPWGISGSASTLPKQGAQVRSLVRELDPTYQD